MPIGLKAHLSLMWKRLMTDGENGNGLDKLYSPTLYADYRAGAL
ncbi:MAG: hypothetical protein ACFE7S_02655 [Candidatus Hodarchaeota archaeon]